MKTAIFLGAGASKADGAPLQSELFKEYFTLIKDNPVGDNRSELRTFFLFLFGLDVDNDNLDKIIFPTFEEALGILDLAENRGEEFKEYDNQNFICNSGRIKKLKYYLVLSMAKVIKEKLNSTKRIHKKLINNLDNKNLMKDVIFISSNYDLLIDTALNKNGYKIDYWINFRNYSKSRNANLEENLIKLFKIHGSLNWLYCPVCNDLTLTKGEKGVVSLIEEPSNNTCEECETLYSPIIVPPTYFKDMTNLFLNTIWNSTESNLLNNVNHIIFCGYSFPEADMHIKYLLKRIEHNRSQNKDLKISVFNYHSEKDENEIKNEKNKFNRFFKSKVNYRKKSFEEFAEEPELFL